MGKDAFEMICNELASAVAKENTMLRDGVLVRQRVQGVVDQMGCLLMFVLVVRVLYLGWSSLTKDQFKIVTRPVSIPFIGRFVILWAIEDQKRVIAFERLTSPYMMFFLLTANISVYDVFFLFELGQSNRVVVRQPRLYDLTHLSNVLLRVC